MREEWLQVHGAPGYLVSSEGRIKTISGKIKKGRLDRNGYRRHDLRMDDGTVKYKYAHRIVAEAFLGPKDSTWSVLWANSIRSDNRVENISWSRLPSREARRRREGASGKECKGCSRGLETAYCHKHVGIRTRYCIHCTPVVPPECDECSLSHCRGCGQVSRRIRDGGLCFSCRAEQKKDARRSDAEREEWVGQAFAGQHGLGGRGVYVLLSGSDVVYVGQSKDISARLRSHQADKDFDTVLTLTELSHGITDVDALEAMLIDIHRPRHNSVMSLIPWPYVDYTWAPGVFDFSK